MERVFQWNVPLLVLVAVGCASIKINQPVDFTKLGPPYRADIYDAGKLVSMREIATGSDEELAITQWLDANRSGWKTTFVTYAPKRVIQGHGFNMNVVDRFCVLNCTPTGNSSSSVQLYKTIKPGELDSIFTKPD